MCGSSQLWPKIGGVFTAKSHFKNGIRRISQGTEWNMSLDVSISLEKRQIIRLDKVKCCWTNVEWGRPNGQNNWDIK